MNTEILKNQLENQLTIALDEQQTLTSEKTSADQDRNLMANRNLELENEIVEHLQGIFFFIFNFSFKKPFKVPHRLESGVFFHFF